MIWVIADTHFNHRKLINNNIRPADYQERIIKNWNNNVKDDDIVIMLGDICWNNDYSVLEQLKGRKILVRGNHDTKSCETYMDKHFDFACETFSINYNGLPLIFSHKPLTDFSELYNIHGHLHSGFHKPSYTTGCHILISLEKMGYTVFSLKSILKNINKGKRYE